MPFVNPTQTGMGQTTAAPLSVTMPTPSTKEVVTDFNLQENFLVGIADALAAPRYIEDPNYDPLSDVAGYEGYIDLSNLADVSSREEMIARKRQIDLELKRKETFANASGLQQFLAVGSLIATDPTMMIPVGTSAYKTYRVGGRILDGATKTAGIAAAVETGREALLQYNQKARTEEESLFNVGAATIVSGILGGAAAGLSDVELERIAKQFDEDMVTPEIKAPSMSTVGAAEVGTTLEQEEIKGLKKTKALFRKIPGFLKNPVWETATSESKTVRKLSEQLSDLSLVKNKNVEGIASEQSVELLTKMYDTLRVPYYNDYNRLWKEYKQRVPRGQRLTNREFNEEIGRALRRGDIHSVPEVQQAAQSVRRNVFEPVLKRAKEVGIFDDIAEIDVATAESWFKRVYDIDKIQARRPEFKQRVLSWLKREREAAEEGTMRAERFDAELDDIAEDIIDRITNVTHGRIPYDLKLKGGGGPKQDPAKRGSAKARVFAIPDEEIEDFLMSDVNLVMENHLRTMAPDNELMGKFGTLDFDNIKKDIQQDYKIMRGALEKNKDLSEAQLNKKMAELEKQLAKDIRNVEAMWQKLRGMYAQPDDYAAPQHVAERMGMSWNFVRLLGDVVASSIPDMGRPVMVHGLNRTYGDLFRAVIKDYKGFKMAKGEVKELGIALDVTNSRTALRRANMDEYMPLTGKMDVVSQKISTGTAALTGINHWNASLKTFSGVMTQNRMMAAIVDLANSGKVAQKELENLASHGIDAAMAKRIAAQFAEHGEKREVLRIANARNWTDNEAKNVFRAAVRKQVDEIIITPGLDRPLWISRPGWRTIGQFKSFSFSSMQRTTLAGLQQADAATVNGLLVSVMLGSMVYAYKTAMAGKPVSEDPRVWIAEGIDRSGAAGWFFDVNNIVEKATRGKIGVNALSGGPPMSRYASRNVTGALLGPSFGAAQDIFQITGGAFGGDFTQSDTHAARRLFPGQNIPYLRGIFDQLESGFNETMGITE